MLIVSNEELQAIKQARLYLLVAVKAARDASAAAAALSTEAADLQSEIDSLVDEAEIALNAADAALLIAEPELGSDAEPQTGEPSDDDKEVVIDPRFEEYDPFER